MEKTSSSTRRLTKKPPPGSQALANLSSDPRGSDNTSLRSQRSSGSLQRAPSAPQPRSNPSYGHTRQSPSTGAAAYSSSNSSLEHQFAGPSPALPSSGFVALEAQGGGRTDFTRPLSEKTSQEFIGAPFDGTTILNHIDSTKASGYQNSLRRPAPPTLSHTMSNPRMMSPPLRQSASFSAGDRMTEKTPPRVSENQLISPKRYSDESKEPKAGMIRKKSGFSGFMNSIGVGTPRNVKISAPENPVHVTHVGYDNTTGQFTVSISIKHIRFLLIT